MSYNIPIFIGVCSLVVSIYTIYIENKRHRLFASVELLLKLNKEYDEEYMKIIRKKIAKFLLRKYKDGFPNSFPKSNIEEMVKNGVDIDEVLDFFEMMGYFLRRDALDEEMVWNNFFNSIYVYVSIAKE